MQVELSWELTRGREKHFCFFLPLLFILVPVELNQRKVLENSRSV